MFTKVAYYLLFMRLAHSILGDITELEHTIACPKGVYSAF